LTKSREFGTSTAKRITAIPSRAAVRASRGAIGMNRRDAASYLRNGRRAHAPATRTYDVAWQRLSS
jgi:hypothetical protein